jgi:hypothetical protein
MWKSMQGPQHPNNPVLTLMPRTKEIEDSGLHANPVMFYQSLQDNQNSRSTVKQESPLVGTIKQLADMQLGSTEEDLWI